MTDDEKVFEAFRVTKWICEIHDKVKDKIMERFRKGNRFPYIQRYKIEDDRKNTWLLLLCCPSKNAKKKGAYYIHCYTTYDVPRKRKENDVNAGKGIILFSPVAMSDMIDRGPDNIVRLSAVIDIVPHAFNRYTERYLIPNGKANMPFYRKVEDMVLRWLYFDIEADLLGDINAKKHKGDNICPYDVFMRGGGMLRGQLVNNMLLRFTTYISDDMMFEGQRERQKAIIKEFWELRKEVLK